VTNTLEETNAGELRAARRLVKNALKAGYVVSVNDGGEFVVKRSNDARAIVAALGSTGEDYLTFRNAETFEKVGMVMLVWGNDPKGEELFADYTDNEAINALVKASEVGQ